MATIDEVRSKLKARLNKYKVNTPTRVAYLGDGRGNAASNIVPPGEPDKYWARESLDGDKPFKVLNRNPDFSPAFNLPVLLGYPEDDPTEEQVMGLHRALIKFSIGNSGSALGGVAPHHTKHEWGGGDEVFVDPRQIKPGLVKPTAPASMAVKILSFQHYWNDWDRYDGGVSDDMTQYKPASDYRYVLVTLDPTVNQIRLRPGNVFTPDLSIDSIISNQANNTFRHIPVPPGNEIPLGCVLLEPSTTKIDWNLNGVNNLLPMRILLGSPMKEINERLGLVEAATGITTVPTTGAANNVPYDLLPARIDGNITRFVHNRSSASENLPELLVGEFGYVNSSPSQLVIGTASGNKVFVSSGGGGAGSLSGLDDVTITSASPQHILKYDGTGWVNSSAIGTNTWSSALAINYDTDVITINGFLEVQGNGVQILRAGGEDGGFQLAAADTVPGRIFTGAGGNAIEFGGANGDQALVEFNGSGGTNKFLYYEQNGGIALELDSAGGNNIFFRTAAITSALDVQYDQNEIIFNASTVRFTTNNYPSALRILRNTNQVIYNAASITYAAGDVTYNALPRFTAGARIQNALSNSALFVDQLTGIYIGGANFTESTPFSYNFGTGLATFGQVNFRIASSANASQLYVDNTLGAVQIGTSVAGQIADFRSHLIEFNKNQNDMDVRFSSPASQNLLYLDGGADQVIVGASSVDTKYTATNVYLRNDVGLPLLIRRDSSGTPAPLTMHNDDSTDGAGLAFAFGTRTTGAGGVEAAQLAQIRGIFDTHNHATRSATVQLFTVQNGSGAVRATIGAGLRIGTTTSGGDLNGWINVLNGIQRNGAAYTNPDYAVEHYFNNGSVVKFANNPGAASYNGLVPLSALENYLETNLHLPNRWESRNLFDWADMAQMWAEELAIYITQLHNRVSYLENELEKYDKLEARLQALEK